MEDDARLNAEGEPTEAEAAQAQGAPVPPHPFGEHETENENRGITEEGDLPPADATGQPGSTGDTEATDED